MVHGAADTRHDGVADYVEHLLDALPSVGVDAVGVRLDSLATTRDEIVLLAPDLVHVQFAPSAYRFSSMPLRLPGALLSTAPLLTTVHEYGWWSWPRWVPDPLWRLVERTGWWDRETGRLLPASAEVAVTNPGHASVVRARLRKPVEVIPLAPNVPGRVVRPDGDERNAHAPTLAFFGYVHPVKGVRYLIDALAALLDRYPELRLLVVGGFTSQALPADEAESFRQELIAHARRRRVADRVEFTGYLSEDEVSARLAEADIGVLPFTEGVSTKSGALLTMLAHGLPTVITEPDEPDPLLRDGREVRAVRARRDSTALASAIDDLLARTELRHLLRTEGLRLASDRNWSRVAEDHRAWYDRVCAGAAGA
ncbi:MAG TPA: glycosyltransferase family 4 protein [Pseudonocardiaceae bacterium]|jgi:glycosyltransferase involved in cell wall biosynthesis